MSIALSITHAAHIPERIQVFANHRPEMQELFFPDVHVETHKGPWPEWAAKQWTWGEGSDCTHVCFLQDDSVCCGAFAHQLGLAVASKPNELICLFHGENLRHAAETARAKGLSWIVTPDEMIGIGYVFPMPLLEQFNRWRRTVMEPSLPMRMYNHKPRLGEDTLIAIWAMASGYNIWHPVPALVEHDLTAKSTWANPESPKVGIGHGGLPLEVDWNTDGLRRPRVRNGNYRWLILGPDGEYGTRPETWKDCRTVERFYDASAGR